MGPISALILILGNVGIILGLFPAHVAWTIYTLIKLVALELPFSKFSTNISFCRDLLCFFFLSNVWQLQD